MIMFRNARYKGLKAKLPDFVMNNADILIKVSV